MINFKHKSNIFSYICGLKKLILFCRTRCPNAKNCKSDINKKESIAFECTHILHRSCITINVQKEKIKCPDCEQDISIFLRTYLVPSYIAERRRKMNHLLRTRFSEMKRASDKFKLTKNLEKYHHATIDRLMEEIE